MPDTEMKKQLHDIGVSVEALLKAHIAHQDNPANSKAALTMSQLQKDMIRKIDSVQSSVDENTEQTR